MNTERITLQSRVIIVKNSHYKEGKRTLIICEQLHIDDKITTYIIMYQFRRYL